MSNEEVQETTEVETSETEEAPSTLMKVDTDSSINASLDEIDDPDTLKKMVKKLRGENAKSRTEKNATKEELAEFKAWKESQMTELEKVQARQKEFEEKYLAKAREAVLLKYGIDEDDDLAEFVTGSEEEMEARAQKLSTRIKSSAEEGLVPDLFKTPGRKPVKVQKDDGANFLEILAQQGRIN